jgi:CheY-like chemotaxis protein
MTFYVSKDKWEYLDKIKTAKWNAWRTEGINWEEDFIWLSDYIFPEEMKVLKAKGVYDSWFPINSSKNPNVLMDVINSLKNKNGGNAKEHMKKILQFDDDTFLGQMYQEKFKLEGFKHIWKEHPDTDKAEDLINYVLEINPNLIVMDIIMPVMDGYKATEILKKDDRTKNIPIFMLTNLSQDEDIEKAKELGAADYFITAHHVPSKFINCVKEYLEDSINYKPKFG